MDVFTQAYVEAALWSSTYHNEFLDANYGVSDIDDETLQKMMKDCEKFQESNLKDIESNLKVAGHDFWLTRNHHGAGFWDGDWEQPAADRLTNASHVFGEVNLYVSDNKVYQD